MTQILKLKIKIILIFSILILAFVGVGIWYLTKMSIVSGNLNINKTNPIDKLCNYNIYSDFYYHVMDKESKNSYAELTPMRTTICYNLKQNRIELQSRIDTESNIILDDTNGDKMEKEVLLLENFKKSYSKIVATQDKDYFTKSYEMAKRTLKALYGTEKIAIEKIDPQKKYYTHLNHLPIDNMVVEYFNLQKITSSVIIVEKKKKWEPNILEWNFGEKDRIYFQYLEKYSNHNLDDYVNNEYVSSTATIVKLTKFNMNKLSKMFLIFYNNQKKVKTLFMDNNGYIYTLIMEVSNKKAFETYFNDYMRIAYGIYFIDKNRLETSFIQHQKEVIKYYKEYLLLANKLVTKYNIIKEYKCADILKNYEETKEIKQKIINYMKIKRSKKYLSFDKQFKKFKQLNKDYPNIDICNTLKNDIKNLELITEAVEKLKPFTIHYKERFKEGANILKKQCSNNIECIKKLKKNDWEVVE